MTIPPPTTEQERHALAERYVLGDPTLDTTAFEALMLEDESLAWAVAAAVEELGLIAQAGCRLAPTPASPVTGVRDNATAVGSIGGLSASRRHLGRWSGLAVAAACLALLCLGPWTTWPTRVSPNPTPSQANIEESLEMSQVAENWLAFETAFAEETVRTSEPEAVAAMPVAAGGVDEEDWLVEAAQLYFAELESSES